MKEQMLLPALLSFRGNSSPISAYGNGTNPMEIAAIYRKRQATGIQLNEYSGCVFEKYVKKLNVNREMNVPMPLVSARDLLVQFLSKIHAITDMTTLTASTSIMAR
ncbi:unnamed protein product, partial [Callosobruchus maculatus]